jgi:cell wall-associated NlpC family hydrolase
MALAKCRFLCRAIPFFLLGPALFVVGTAAPSAAASPTQSQIAATEAQVAGIESTIANEQQQSAALDSQFLAAQATVQQIQTALAATQKQLATTRANVRVDKVHLAHDAVYAYVYDEPANRLDAVFANSPTASNDRSQYEDAVVGNVTLAVDALATQQAKLTATTTLEQTQAQQATNALNQVHALQIANQQAAAAAQATLNQIQGTLAVEVSEYATAQAQAEAAYAAAHPGNAGSAARTATQDAGVAVALGGSGAASAAAAANQAAAAGGAKSATGSSTGSGAGEAAVEAAESQLGVAYVWGGESPGRGFDCSGLTQWSWAQAGVSIPRTAATQAAALPTVPLNALEPGDLLFYYDLDGDNTIDHVVMYVGSGPFGDQTIIQAPYTGSEVQYAPLFTEGLVAAGRP